ncbi:hypothetical protein [Rhodoferax sp. TS-BS-61-7]|uniref:hypothetical protein n=1 Tax=Rhodoferax sp. TS-BS-61-7 TaxID=2094194 RepID=UPI0013749A43|nr:hypothetical protein [Rhodoferax sp. TS-BS-61-7]
MRAKYVAYMDESPVRNRCETTASTMVQPSHKRPKKAVRGISFNTTPTPAWFLEGSRRVLFLA